MTLSFRTSMPQTIESLIKLAETDRDLQKYVFAKSHLERQIDTARSVVDQHQKTIKQKNHKDRVPLLFSKRAREKTGAARPSI